MDSFRQPEPDVKSFRAFGVGPWVALIAVCLGTLSVPAVAAARVPAWVSEVRGPQLETPQKALEDSVSCDPGLRSAPIAPVLLVHGTAINEEETYGWNLLKILPRHHIPTCVVRLPNRALTDVQVTVEYVVHAIRSISSRARRRIAIVGHSQGAFHESYALRFWPDIRKRLTDVIGIDGAYERGTTVGNTLCSTPFVCTDALRQVTAGSRLLEAYGRRPNPRGPDYTGMLTLTDELVQPQPAASTLRAPGARNYILQELCPGAVSEHGLSLGERSFVALVLDALTHRGPARVDRLGRVPCGGLIPEATDSYMAPVGILAALVTEAPKHPSTVEPPLRCYLERRLPDAAERCR